MDAGNLSRLALALAIGLLAGLERGWQKRNEPEGSRVAGFRTFGLIGLLGGLWALLAGSQTWVLAMGGIALALLLAAGYRAGADARGDLGLTTEVAALAVFALGALAVRGHTLEAAAGGVVMTGLLSLKPLLHRWLGHLNESELLAAIQLLLISIVVLPNLPDRGFGPWEALNPRHIWWMVALIAGISFAGYVSGKVLGPRGGIAATSLLGGLVSSTAVTLSMARLDQVNPKGWRLHAAGVVIASAVMFPRILLEVSVVNHDLLGGLVPSLTAAALIAFLGAWLLLRFPGEHPASPSSLKNPMELGAALFFGALLAVVTLAAVALRHWLGDAGVYLTSAAAGLMDVDATTLSLARLAGEGMDPEVASRGILVAAGVNTVSKAVMAAAISGGRLGWACAGILGAALAAGAAVLVGI